jgi:ADP-heptose:LPS heptosyltransferase
MNTLVVKQPAKVRKPHNSRWVIVTFKRSLLWMRHMAEKEGDTDETWMLNPPRRYILNANQLEFVEEYIETISDLKNAAYYKPLLVGKANLAGARILIERYRDRGIGDLLFLTGPLAYLQHLSGNTCKIYLYALAERGQVIFGNPALQSGSALYGPVMYDDLPLHHYHWFIDTLTEYDEEPEQLNVYDALYQQLGLDYNNIDPRFKRPYVHLDETDAKNLDSFYYFVWRQKGIDLRKTGYYIVAPLTHGSLRSMPYMTWLHLIRELAERRPVVVIGQMTDRMPMTDMPAERFHEEVNRINGPVINMMGGTPLRVVMSMISKAVAAVCLDSAPLYIAQACRVPTVSIWGPHHPGVRIGHDKEYMDLAIWNHEACRNSPCFAYNGFPAHKCPAGESQYICEVLRNVDAQVVIEKMNIIEGARRGPSVFKAAVPDTIPAVAVEPQST